MKTLALSLAILSLSTASNARTPAAELATLEAKLKELAATDLPDFALRAFQSVQKKTRDLRSAVDRNGEVTPEDVEQAGKDLLAFQALATRTRRSIGNAYGLRNTAIQWNFIRAFDARAFDEAGRSYDAALQLAGEQRFDEARQRASEAARQYQALMNNAKNDASRMLTGTLQQYQRAIAADVTTLRTSAGDSGDLPQIEGVSARMRPPRFDTSIDPPVARYYQPALPDPPGPDPTISPQILSSGATTVRLQWFDLSHDEAGNRVLRSTDQSSWQTLAETDRIPIYASHEYTDRNLQPDTQYCYAIESFNAVGARRSQTQCTYTRFSNDIDVWRLQLRVNIADLENAGIDRPLKVIIGSDRLGKGVETFLDYGGDDFERDSDALYDLNLGGIRKLRDITEFSVIHTGKANDIALIEDIDLLVNNKTVFHRHFGATATSALRLTEGHRVEHAELRSNREWQEYVRLSASEGFNLPAFDYDEQGDDARTFHFYIPQAEIVSRIESIVGNAQHADTQLRGRIKWGYLSGAAVEIEQAGTNTIRVDLDTEAIVPLWSNPALDIDFDIDVTKKCNADDQRKLKVALASKNFRSNAGFEQWQAISAPGPTKLVEAVVEWLAGNAATSIDESFDVTLPENIDCNDVEISVDEDAQLILCCFTLPE